MEKNWKIVRAGDGTEWDFSYERDGSERYIYGDGEYLIYLYELFDDEPVFFTNGEENLRFFEGDDFNEDDYPEGEWAVDKDSSTWCADLFEYTDGGNGLEMLLPSDGYGNPFKALDGLERGVNKFDWSLGIADFFNRAMNLFWGDRDLYEKVGNRVPSLFGPPTTLF